MLVHSSKSNSGLDYTVAIFQKQFDFKSPLLNRIVQICVVQNQILYRRDLIRSHVALSSE